MNNKDDFYELLGVSYFASEEEIRKAYISKIKLYHPDKFKGSKRFAEDVTSKINIAYDTLTDRQKKQKYDLDNGFIEKRNKILKEKQHEEEIEKKLSERLAKQKEKEMRRKQKQAQKKQNAEKSKQAKNAEKVAKNAEKVAKTKEITQNGKQSSSTTLERIVLDCIIIALLITIILLIILHK